MVEIPNNQLGCKKNPENNGMYYQPQLVSWISAINSSKTSHAKKQLHHSNFHGNFFFLRTDEPRHIFWSKQRLHQGNQNFEATLVIDFSLVGKKLVKQNNQHQTKRKLLKSTTLPTSGKLITSNEMYLLVGCNILIQRIWGGNQQVFEWFFCWYPNKTHPPATKRPCDIDRSKEVVSITDKTERTPMRLRPTEDTWVLGPLPWQLGAFGANNDMFHSKKSPTGPTERTPKPEYLISLAPYLGVRW